MNKALSAPFIPQIMRLVTPILLLSVAVAGPTSAQAPRLQQLIDQRAAEIEAKVVAWRRDLHQHPELGNREVRTAKIVADHLRSLGIEVRTGVAVTGVVGTLRGGRPGPVVALRADMDALPVAEEVDLPFKSTVRTQFAGQEVGVMHACGHDNHVAILMGVAEILASMKAQIPGTVRFLFQPAEEGPPAGERGGAGLMIEQGALAEPKVDAVFGLHVFPFPVGTVTYRAGGAMASSDSYHIVVRGRQTHGALPWNGVDPIVLTSQIISNMQSIISRNTDLTLTPAILTVGYIRGGVRFNIIPDSVEFGGTIRTFDESTRDSIHTRLTRLAQNMAAAAGARVDVKIEKGNPVTYNDPALTTQMAATLRRVLGERNVSEGRQTTTAEDFALYEKQVPGMFFFLGVTPPDVDPAKAAPNHSPRFFADERALVPGMRALASLAIDYLSSVKS